MHNRTSVEVLVCVEWSSVMKLSSDLIVKLRAQPKKKTIQVAPSYIHICYSAYLDFA